MAACERPAREVPEDVNGEETPTNTLDEAKPEEALPGAEQSNGETTSEPAPAGEGDATGDTTETEGETADETESGEATETEGDTTIVPATEDEQPQNITYEIESGDTLYAIGVLYGVSVDDIVRANNLPNADSLEVGQLIIIPVGGLPDEPAATNGEGSDDGEATTSEELIHIVSADRRFSLLPSNTVNGR